jgi:hypothetical protein
MQIDDAINAIMRLLQSHEFRDRTEVIAEMQITRGLNTGKDELGESLH